MIPTPTRLHFGLTWRPECAPPDSCKLPISISFASSPLVRPVGQSVIPRPIRSWRCSCSRNICREKPVFAGKVTSGVRNETNGQSWPSNTVATDPFTGQNRKFKVWQRYPAQTSGRLAAKDFVPSVSNASLHWDGSTWSLELLTFFPNQPRQGPFCSCDGREVAAVASNGPIAGSQTRTGGPVKLLCRENLALSTALFSVMSPANVSYNPCRRIDTPIAAGHTRYGTDEMDFDPVCVDDCRTVVCRVTTCAVAPSADSPVHPFGSSLRASLC